MRKKDFSYTTGCGGNANSVELTNLTLNQDDTGYFLSATFKVETEHSIREIDIPKIQLNINPYKVCIETEYSPYSKREMPSINLGFGWLPLGRSDFEGHEVFFTEKILEEKYTEMTLDEIEKKLGYKVKIVSK